MGTVPEPSFEAVHLVSTLLVRFNWVCKKCKLDVEQLYILAYIKSHGQITLSRQKMILRGDITKVLKEVFGCNDTQVSEWVIKLCSKHLLREVTLDQGQKGRVATTRRGRKALVLTAKGTAKVSLFRAELEKLRRSVASEAHSLRIPGMDSHGAIASGILLFLGMFGETQE